MMLVSVQFVKYVWYTWPSRSWLHSLLQAYVLVSLSVLHKHASKWLTFNTMEVWHFQVGNVICLKKLHLFYICLTEKSTVIIQTSSRSKAGVGYCKIKLCFRQIWLLKTRTEISNLYILKYWFHLPLKWLN